VFLVVERGHNRPVRLADVTRRLLYRCHTAPQHPPAEEHVSRPPSPCHGVPPPSRSSFPCSGLSPPYAPNAPGMKEKGYLGRTTPPASPIPAGPHGSCRSRTWGGAGS